MTNPALINIVGGGLAGAEAAWQAQRQGVRVRLFEMKPERFSPAHQSPLLGELVCSNSLRSEAPDSAIGLLKNELRRLGSLIMGAAAASRVPAGKALAVDRQAFARFITEALAEQPDVEIVRQEVTALNFSEPAVIATGPLTTDSMAESLRELTGREQLHFYDAISPIVFADSINHDIVFRASRYGAGDDYLNCPLTEADYQTFYQALTTAELMPLRTFEEARFFEGCLPIEVMAARGYQTLLFGPMKPVGLVDPHTGRQPFAVVQLRQENREGELYNLVGFQTRLKYGEQRRVLRLLPGLEQAEFARLGSVHRNTFIHSPGLLSRFLNFAARPQLFLGGQITGVEGYLESTAMGWLAGVNAARLARQQPLLSPPPETAMGALVRHITNTEVRDFQPMNVNFGLFPPLPGRVPKKGRGAAYAQRALEALEAWLARL